MQPNKGGKGKVAADGVWVNDPWAQFTGVNVPLPQTPSVVSESSQQQAFQQAPGQQQFLGKGTGSCLFGTTPPGLVQQQQQTGFVGGAASGSGVGPTLSSVSFEGRQQQFVGQEAQQRPLGGVGSTTAFGMGQQKGGFYPPLGQFASQQIPGNVGGSPSLSSDPAVLQGMVVQLLGRVQQMEQAFANSGVRMANPGNATVGFQGSPGMCLGGGPTFGRAVGDEGASAFGSEKKPIDLFNKTDMKLPPCPTPKVESWKDRESEITGFHDFIGDLRAWAALASADFAAEIFDSARAVSEIDSSYLSREQQVRGSRLLAILKSCFAGHPRTDNLIRSFQEGVGISGVRAGMFCDNGYELLRILTGEYSLKTRSEALALRAELTNKNFRLANNETSQSTMVADTVRKIDTHVSRFQKLISTLPPGVDRNGIMITESDQLLMLLKNLPNQCSEYVMLHSASESYKDARDSALRYERQRRLFSDFGRKHIHEVFGGAEGNPSVYDMTYADGDQDWEGLNAMGGKGGHGGQGGNKCRTCGSKKHRSEDCDTDMSKLACFKCGQKGHISANCRNKGVSTQSGKAGKGKEKGKMKSKKGFKGKMNEVAEEDNTQAEGDQEWWDWPNEEKKEATTTEGQEHVTLASVFDFSVNEQHETNLNFGFEVEFFEEIFMLGPNCTCLNLPGSMSHDASAAVLHELRRRVVENGFQKGFMTCDAKWSVKHEVEVNCKHGLDHESCVKPWTVVSFAVMVMSCFAFVFQMICKKERSHLKHVVLFMVILAGIVITFQSSLFSGVPKEHLRQVMHPDSAQDGIWKSGGLRLPMSMSPLLSAVECSTEAQFWLLDSGAAATVVNREFLDCFEHTEVVPCVQCYFAANGSPVHMDGMCVVSGRLLVLNTQTKREEMKRVSFACLVGRTQHNILSTNLCNEQGWEFILSKAQHKMSHATYHLSALEIVEWGKCPWLILHPDSHEKTFLSPIRVVGNAGESDLEMMQHRMQGHIPYLPHCLTCQRARGVTQHRRRKAGILESEVQADFCFIQKDGQVLSSRTQSSIRCLALKECFSGNIACIVMSGDVESDRRILIHWMHEFGLSSANTSVVLTTDAEEAVSSFVSQSSSEFNFLIRKAGPQNHEAVGHVERCIRTIREGIAITLDEFRHNGMDFLISIDTLPDLLKYVCMANNMFSKAHGSNLSPREVVVGRIVKENHFAAFLSEVIAEIPDSIHEKFPSASRSIEAFFLFPAWSSQSNEVVGKLVKEGRIYWVRFIAKAIKVVFPLRWNIDSHDGLMKLAEGSEPVEHAVDDEPFERIVEPNQGLALPSPSLKCPTTGPPVEWLRENGFKDGCYACESLKTKNTRKGKVHSRACCRRYEEWLVKSASRIEGGSGSSSAHHVNMGDDVRPEGSRPFSEQELEDFERQFDEPSRESKRVRFDDPSSGSSWPPGVPRRRQPKGPDPRDHVMVSEDVPDSNGNIEQSNPVENDNDENLSEYVPTTPREGPSDMEDVEVPEELTRHSVKRSSEVPLEDLEQELEVEQDRERRRLMELGDMAFTDLMSCLCESPSFCQNEIMVESVRFSQQIDTPESCIETFCGGKVRVWKPSDAIDDSSGELLDGQLTYDGMQAEIQHMEACAVGDQMSAEDWKVKALQLQRELGVTPRLITTRWVTTAKADKVRARIVVRDMNHQEGTARNLGISSPTPSSDSLMVVLSVVSHYGWLLGSYDVSHAFMHTPRKVRDVAIRMPQSITSPKGESVVLWLRKALNGLRSASLEWLLYLQDILRPLGLESDRLQPCLFSGRMASGGRALLLTYVDDILYTTEIPKDAEVLKQCLKDRVPIKDTGFISPNTSDGGTLVFIGREIVRLPGEKTLFVKVPSDYLDKTFASYGLKSVPASAAAPSLDVLEKTDGVPLSSEAHTRFRSALGKLAWMSQTRQDLRVYIALLATQQSCPTSHTESGLRSLLRFLASDMHIALSIPSQDESFGSRDIDTPVIVCYTDASHAPRRSTNRKSVSGGVLTFLGSLIKSYSRHQQSISLSACESEMTAIQSICQESLVLSRIVSRILRSFQMKEAAVTSKVVTSDVFTDSESSLKLLKGIDLPRRSRHIEVKVEWVKEQILKGLIQVKFRRGTQLVADLLTKCLQTTLFQIHRTTMGFIPMSPIGSLINAIVQIPVAILEVCCGENSAICRACDFMNIPYHGVSAEMEVRSVFLKAKAWRESLGKDVWVHVHLSTPCLVGSPLKNFSFHSHDQEIQWCSIIKCSASYMQLGSSSSFELPKSNSIWDRWFTQRLLEKQNHVFECFVNLCKTELLGRSGLPIAKQLRFTSDSWMFTEHLFRRFGVCDCPQHSCMNDVHWAKTATYTWKLGKEIVRAAQRAANCEV